MLTPFDGGNDVLAPLVREFTRLQLKFDIWIGVRSAKAVVSEPINDNVSRKGPEHDPEGFAVWTQADCVKTENIVFTEKLGFDPSRIDGIQSRVHLAADRAFEFATMHDQVLSDAESREAEEVVKELRLIAVILQGLRETYARTDVGNSLGDAPITWSIDFKTVCWGGRRFEFAAGNQAKAVGVLLEHWRRGDMTVSESAIGEAIESSGSFRVLTTFRIKDRRRKIKSHPAVGTMIVSAGKGKWKIAEPPKSQKNHT